MVEVYLDWLTQLAERQSAAGTATTLYRHGDLLTCTNCQVITNAVNVQGVSGAGIALAFKQQFSHSQRVYETTCREGRLQAGGVLLIPPAGTGMPLVPTSPPKADWRKPFWA